MKTKDEPAIPFILTELWKVKKKWVVSDVLYYKTIENARKALVTLVCGYGLKWKSGQFTEYGWTNDKFRFIITYQGKGIPLKIECYKVRRSMHGAKPCVWRTSSCTGRSKRCPKCGEWFCGYHFPRHRIQI